MPMGLETNARGQPAAGSRVRPRRLSGRILGGHAPIGTKLESLLARVLAARMICIRRDLARHPGLVRRLDRRAGGFLHAPGFAPFVARGSAATVAARRAARRTLLPFPEILRRGARLAGVPDVLQLSFEDLVGPSGGGDAQAQSAAIAAIHCTCWSAGAAGGCGSWRRSTAGR